MNECVKGAMAKTAAGFLVREDLHKEIDGLREAVSRLRDKLGPISSQREPDSPSVCSEGPAQSEYFSSIYRAATTIGFLTADIHKICNEIEL